MISLNPDAHRRVITSQTLLQYVHDSSYHFANAIFVQGLPGSPNLTQCNCNRRNAINLLTRALRTYQPVDSNTKFTQLPVQSESEIWERNYERERERAEITHYRVSERKRQILTFYKDLLLFNLSLKCLSIKN